MPRKYQGLSFTEHQKIGKEILELRRHMLGLEGRVSDAYGKSSRAARYAGRVVKDLALLRGELDERVCQENPGRDNVEILACYYPKGKQP